VRRRCCKQSGCVHLTNGSCQKECSVVCSNRSIPGLLYVLKFCRRFGWIIITCSKRMMLQMTWILA